MARKCKLAGRTQLGRLDFPRGKERTDMKHMTKLAALLALFLVPAAFAGGSSQLTLSKNISVNGKDVRAGNYKVKWQGTGDMVDVSFTQGKHVLATAPGHVVALDRAPSDDTLVYQQNADGTQSLSEIRFGGKRFALVLGEQNANASMANHQAGSTANK